MWVGGVEFVTAHRSSEPGGHVTRGFDNHSESGTCRARSRLYRDIDLCLCHFAVEPFRHASAGVAIAPSRTIDHVGAKRGATKTAGVAAVKGKTKNGDGRPAARIRDEKICPDPKDSPASEALSECGRKCPICKSALFPGCLIGEFSPRLRQRTLARWDRQESEMVAAFSVSTCQLRTSIRSSAS
jgi:hypothetical protein